MQPLELALHYNATGYPVFPCRAKPEEVVDQNTGEVETKHEKTPYTSNGLKGATRLTRILNRWWSDNPDALVGVPTGAPSGFWVLDLDVKPGVADGHIWLDSMESTHGALPATARAKTANGGTHIFFRHVEGVRNRGGLGSGVDVRGDGGYVVMPGSRMADGRTYEWISEAPIADAPEWLLELVLPRAATASPAQPFSYVAGTNDHYVNKAVDDELRLLASTGQGGRGHQLNASAYALGQFVGAGALSRSEAENALYGAAVANGVVAKDGERETWAKIRRGLDAGVRAPRSIPEGDQDNTRLVDVTRMIRNGLERGKAKRAAATAVMQESVSEAADYTEENISRPAKAEEQPAEPANDNEPEQPESPFRATAFKWVDPSTLPRREFAFGTHYIRKYVSVTVSPGGLGKTSNSIVEALSMVSGRQLAGVKPKEKLNVWLFNAEDPRDEMQRRIMAACLHYNLKPEHIEGRLFLDTGREQELIVMHEDKKTGLQVNEPIVEAVVEQILANEIDVMIVDPFVSTHRVNENDNGAIDKVAKLWAQIADYTNCAVDVVHHLKKLADREATVEDARGAVSLIGAARSVRVLNRMSDEQAIRAGIAPKERFSYFWIHHGKVNLTKMDNSEHWRKLESVSLGNGATNPLRRMSEPHDTAGVVTEWLWPSKEEIAESVPDDVRRGVLVKLGNQNYRESAQSEDWAGYVLAEAMGMSLETGKAMTADKRKVKAVLDAWIENGILAIVNEPDPKHIDRKIKYIRPAEQSS